MSEAQHCETDSKEQAPSKLGPRSPLSGAQLPRGRTKGVPNKTTQTVRDAVMKAFNHVGGWAYLAELAQGTQSDRTAFVSLLNKVLPTQINANVQGGIQVQLGWLQQRQIGGGVTPATQIAEQVTQVIDLEQDKQGKYRITDARHEVVTLPAQSEPVPVAEISRPPTPPQSAGGGSV